MYNYFALCSGVSLVVTLNVLLTLLPLLEEHGTPLQGSRGTSDIFEIVTAILMSVFYRGYARKCVIIHQFRKTRVYDRRIRSRRHVGGQKCISSIGKGTF